MTVEIADLGTWGGASLLAEYDPCDDTIRVDARAVETIRMLRGEAEAQRFITVAIAHERFHRSYPRGTEAQAHAYARACCGAEPASYERLVKLARGRAH